MENILVIDGHPDADPARFGHALAAAYVEGAREAGRTVRVVRIADLEFPLLRSQRDWIEGRPTEPIADAQASLQRADRLAIFFPLWLGDMPALLKGFLEQALRPGFAIRYHERGFPEKLLEGRSADVVVTMGMPAPFYRYWYGAHGVRSLKRNILHFVGIAPVRTTLIGQVQSAAADGERWLRHVNRLAGRDL
jgi:putative NADPH-quinone reductase